MNGHEARVNLTPTCGCIATNLVALSRGVVKHGAVAMAPRTILWAVLRRKPQMSSPIGHLPSEVLGHVFDLATQLQTECEGLTLRSLTQVNRLWRDVAIARPRLWTDLGDIVVTTKTTNAQKFRIGERVTTFIRRSEPLPFEFILAIREELDFRVAPCKLNSASDYILKILARYSDRWRRVKLCVPIRELDALESVSGRLRSLEVLALEVNLEGNRQSQNIQQFAVAPRLRSTYLEFRYFYYDRAVVPTVALPWAQLEDFTENGTRASEIAFPRIMTSAIHLRTLACRVPDKLYSWIGEQTPLRRENLTQLHISLVSVHEPRPLLQCLVLPSLKDLMVTFWEPEYTLTNVASLLRISDCRLHTLSLVCTDDWHEDGSEKLSEVLKLCPELRHLLLSHVPLSDCPALAGHGTAAHVPPLTPHLQTFDILLDDLYTRRWDYSAVNSFFQAHYGDSTTALDSPPWRIRVKITPFHKWDALMHLATLESQPRCLPETYGMARVMKWARTLQDIRKWTLINWKTSWFRSLSLHARALRWHKVLKDIEEYPIRNFETRLLYVRAVSLSSRHDSDG